MTTVSEIKAIFTARKESLEHAQNMLKGVLLGQGYIVHNGSAYITYDVETIDGQRQATNPHLCAPEKCIRFDKETAERIAANTWNGNNESVYTVIHITQAIENDLETVNTTLAAIESM